MRLIREISGIVIFYVFGLIRVQAQTVTDIDGNVYNTVSIGSQVWMKENLRTTKLSDGTIILLMNDNDVWAASITPGYCWYNNETTYKNTYGALYNWYSINTRNICPAGWHVPSDAEWHSLALTVDANAQLADGIESYFAGGKLKEAGTNHWLSPNTGATDEKGFTALPGSYRFGNGTYANLIGTGGFWWSTGENSAGSWCRTMSSPNSYVSRWYYYAKRDGFSVRCLKDIISGFKSDPSTSATEIYPNPVSGILTIEYKNDNFETVNVLNSQGVLLTIEKTITHQQQIDFSKYVPGLYFLEFVRASGEIKRVKVIKY